MGYYYTKEQITRELDKSRTSLLSTAQDVQRLVLTLSATMLTILFPVGYVLKLSTPGRILLAVCVLLLSGCLLAGIAAAGYKIRMEGLRNKRLRDFRKNYEKYTEQYPITEQMRRLQVDRSSLPTALATVSAILFVCAVTSLCALLCLILFP